MEVLIQMDEAWHWWPTPDDSQHIGQHLLAHRQVQIEMPEAFFSRYEKLKTEWYELQNELEHMYRHQEGLRAFPDSPYYKKEEGNVKTQP